MKKIALDTNIGIDLLNGKTETLKKIENYDLICLPVIVCGELLYGAKNSGNAKKNISKFRTFIESCTILIINAQAAEVYSDIRKKLKDQGRPIPENDIWIAAISSSNNIPLATNGKHFQFVDDLTTVKIP